MYIIEGVNPEFLFNYTQIILFLKNHHVGKCSRLIFLYIIEYNNISWRPTTPTRPRPPPKNLGVATLQAHRIDAHDTF